MVQLTPEEYIKNHFHLPYAKFIEEMEKEYGLVLTRHQIARVLKGSTLRLEDTMKRDTKGRFVSTKTPQEQVEEDRLLRSLREGKKQTVKKYNVLLSEVE
jgi:hypothetical protein